MQLPNSGDYNRNVVLYRHHDIGKLFYHSYAAERIEVVRGIALLETSHLAEQLAAPLIQRLAVPASQPRDALHIATAAANSVQFIVTWNFKHILNPHLQTRITDTCREGGYNPPVICTPQQLLETEDVDS